MAKKEQYYVLAEKYYVEEQTPISGIAQKLNITEKTLHNWRKNGNWEDKRTKFLRSQCNCYASLYELVHKMTSKITDEFEAEGKMPDGSALYFISKMMDKLPKLKKFENEMITEKLNVETKPINKDVLAQVNKFLTGE